MSTERPDPAIIKRAGQIADEIIRQLGADGVARRTPRQLMVAALVAIIESVGRRVRPDERADHVSGVK